MSDYPAAHSMDTEWFAVDADGRVGSFWSGEDGSVPRVEDRPPRIDDVVGAIMYLENATFVTGEILHVDGGQSAGH